MNFVELLQEHRVPYESEGHRHTRPGWINFDCPWCGTGSHKWHMGYNLAYGYVNCWRCGRHNLAETLAEVLSLERKDVHKLLKDVELVDEPPERKKRGAALAVPSCVGPLERPHKLFLRRRGFRPEELATLWNIGGIGLRGISCGLQWRIYIPIHYHGEVVSWTTRSISNKAHRKYRTAEAHQELISHKELLYGEDYVRNTALVFEGPPDVWRVGPGAVCTFGTQWSLQQLFQLTKYPRVVVCFDLEAAAQKRARQLAELLDHQGVDALQAFIPRKGQDLDKSEVKKLRRDWL